MSKPNDLRSRLRKIVQADSQPKKPKNEATVPPSEWGWRPPTGEAVESDLAQKREGLKVLASLDEQQRRKREAAERARATYPQHLSPGGRH